MRTIGFLLFENLIFVEVRLYNDKTLIKGRVQAHYRFKMRRAACMRPFLKLKLEILYSIIIFFVTFSPSAITVKL